MTTLLPVLDLQALGEGHTGRGCSGHGLSLHHGDNLPRSRRLACPHYLDTHQKHAQQIFCLKARAQESLCLPWLRIAPKRQQPKIRRQSDNQVPGMYAMGYSVRLPAQRGQAGAGHFAHAA